MRNGPRAVVVGCAFAALAIGVLDLVTGSEISVALFYLMPIAGATWFAGRRAGWAMCLLAVGLRVADIWFTTNQFSHPVTPYWNAGIELGFFLSTASVLARLRSAMAREATLARTDPLTGLLNRRAFVELASRELERAERHGGSLSLAYLDLDDFKTVNDRGGHELGDRLLAAIAAALHASVRAVDVVARVGGDEFLVLLPDTAVAVTGTVVDKLVAAVGAAAAEVGWPTSVSVGVVTVVGGTISLDLLVNQADALAYAAKRAGKNRVRRIELDRDGVDRIRGLPRERSAPVALHAAPSSFSSLSSVPFFESRAVSR